MDNDQLKYFYDCEAEDFAEILQLTDKLIEYKYMQYDRTFCLTLDHFIKLGMPVNFLTEKEYLFERLKRG
jgi:hypothetical protein